MRTLVRTNCFLLVPPRHFDIDHSRVDLASAYIISPVSRPDLALHHLQFVFPDPNAAKVSKY